MGLFDVNADRLVSITAIIVSVGTLFLIIYQTNLYRQQQKAAVLPYLEIGVSMDDDGSNVHVANNGTGPAFIKSIRVRYHQLEVEDDPYAFYMKLYKDSTSKVPPLYVDRIHPGLLIPAGKSVEMLGVNHSKAKALEFARLFLVDSTFNLHVAATDQAIIEITYASVYGDTWKTRNDWGIPKVVP